MFKENYRKAGHIRICLEGIVFNHSFYIELRFSGPAMLCDVGFVWYDDVDFH
ncbi:hypothetical protein D083_0415 [Dickeya solani RNS 08.23.3.1.A]|nr:hypothetical protein D083_0415 [Dickeya solani RNS 08.23.3.1.A]